MKGYNGNFNTPQDAEFDGGRSETIKVVKRMQSYGGSFVRALAEAALMADEDNLRRIIRAFPELWLRYTVNSGPQLIPCAPFKNAAGQLCGTCDGTYEHFHERSKCKICGVEGLTENMINHSCTVTLAPLKERVE